MATELARAAGALGPRTSMLAPLAAVLGQVRCSDRRVLDGEEAIGAQGAIVEAVVAQRDVVDVAREMGERVAGDAVEVDAGMTVLELLEGRPPPGGGEERRGAHGEHAA